MDVAVHRADVLERGALHAPSAGSGSAGNARRRCAGARSAADGGCRRPGRRANCRPGSWRGRPCRATPRRSNPRMSGTAPARGPGRPRGTARWELAPGSPWIDDLLHGRRRYAQPAAASKAAGAFEVARRVDAERNATDQRHVDAHAGLERTKLLQALALFERRRRQGDVALQRFAAEGIEADMVIERPLAEGCGGAGEIEGAEDALGDRRARPP